MANADTQVLTIRCRLQPTATQRRALEAILEQQRILYNACLEERIDAYRKVGKTVSRFDQSRSLTEIRAFDPEFAAVSRRIQACTIKRLHLAYEAFFRRVREGVEDPGFPKFKGREYWKSFGFDSPEGARFRGGRLRFSGFPGGLRVSKKDRARLPAALVSGKGQNWKGLHIRLDGERWSACFQIESQVERRPSTCGSAEIGVDWGTSALAALSTGEYIVNPRPRERLAKELARVEREVSRKVLGSRGRRKARARKKAIEARIVNRRRTYLDKVSKRLVTHFGGVAVEKIDVKSMVSAAPDGNTPLAVQKRRNREAHDAAPAMLRQMIEYKSTKYRCRLAVVEAAGTTQECSGCGTIVPKELADAVHACTQCGLTLPRKVNAARVILGRAEWGPGDGGKPPNEGDGPRRPGNTDAAKAASGPRRRKAAHPIPHTHEPVTSETSANVYPGQRLAGKRFARPGVG